MVRLFLVCFLTFFLREGLGNHIPLSYFSPVSVNKYFLQNTVTGIELDSKGKMWISTQFGLYTFDGYNVKHFNQYNSKIIKSNRISGVYKIENDIYFEDDKSNFYKVKGNSIVHSFNENIIVFNNTGFKTTNGNRFNYKKIELAPTNSSGIILPKFGSVSLPDSFNYNVSEKIIKWTWGRISMEFYTLENSKLLYKSNDYLGVQIDHKILIWEKNKQLPSYSIDIPSFLKADINCILPLVDDKKLYIGTANYGILESKLIGDYFYRLPILNEQFSPYSYSYCFDQKHNSIYSLVSDGFFKWASTNKNSGICLSVGKWTGSFCKLDDFGYVWYSQNYKLIKLNSRTNKIVYRYDIPSKNFIEDVFWMNGNMYLVSNESVFQLIDNKIVPRFALKDNALIHKVKQKNAKLYCCTNNGLKVFDENFKEIESFFDGISVRDICFDYDNQIFVATYGSGIKQISKNNKITNFEIDPYSWLLTSHSVRILKDILIVGTNKGVIEYQLNKKVPNSQLKFKFYSASEFFGCNEINGGVYPEYAKLNPNLIYFATDKGLVRLTQEMRKLKNKYLNFSIGYISVDERKIPYPKNDSLTIYENYISLKIGLDFIDYSLSDQPKIFYRIKELNGTWNPLAENREILINRLPIGKYKLEIYNGYEIKTLIFEIPRPFYLTWWFFIALVVFIVTFVIAMMDYKYKSKLKYQKELEKIVDVRTVHLNETLQNLNLTTDSLKNELQFKNKLYAVLMHDLKSPLLFLSQSILITLTEKSNVKEYKNALKIAAHTSHELYHFVHEFLQWLGTQFVDFKPQSQPINLALLVQEVLKIYQPISELNQIEIRSNYLNDQKLMILSDRILLESIVRNLMDNSIKYNESNYIQLDIENKNGKVFLIFKNQNPLPQNIVHLFYHSMDYENDDILSLESVVKMGWKIMLVFGKIINVKFHYQVLNDRAIISLELNDINPGQFHT